MPFHSASHYIQEAKQELFVENPTSVKPVRTVNDIQIALFDLAELQRKHPVITPKLKQLINDLQAEMLQFELDKNKLKEASGDWKGFTPDMIRTLATWAQNLKLSSAQKSGFELYHKMTVNKKNPPSSEEINSIGMSLVQIIKNKEKDKEHFWKVMKAWNLMD